MEITTINPATEQMVATYPAMSLNQVNQLIVHAHHAQQNWEKLNFQIRADKLLALEKLLKKYHEQFAQLITTEMGKPIVAAREEIEKCQWICRHYAEHAPIYLAQQTIETHCLKSYVIYQPLGVLLAIMPWNYPFWQVFRFAVPTIMAGNACLLRHAEITTGSSFAIESLFQEAGFPKYLFQSIVCSHDDIKVVIQHDLIRGVTLTGSERAGRAVASTAGKNLKKVVLELGGCDPYIVFDDADLSWAAQEIVKSRLNNAGQVCIAAKRIIAEHSIYSTLLSHIQELLPKYKIGSPMLENTKLGPLARADLRNTVHQQVQQSIAAGAQLVCGGVIPSKIGFYYPPTVLINVKPGMPAFDEEIFGPVISLISVENKEEAIALANRSRYGLSSAIFTKNIVLGEKMACLEMQTGICYVNGSVSSDPRLPFGGVKSSGFGRELGAEGIREFTNVKTVCVVR